MCISICIFNTKIVMATNNKENISIQNENSEQIRETDAVGTKSKIDLFTKVLECGYYIVGIFAFIALVNGARQNKLLAEEINNNKKIADDSFKRETASMTVQRCKEYAEEIIPMIAQTSKKIAENKIYKYTNDLTLDDFNNKEKEAEFQRNNFYGDEEAYEIYAKTANRLEAYAMYFTEEVCDEEIAFKATGETFVTVANRLYPFILHYRVKYKSNGYSNLVKLYSIWNKRLNQEMLTGKESELEKMTKNLEKQKQLIKEQKINNSCNEKLIPIGLKKN